MRLSERFHNFIMTLIYWQLAITGYFKSLYKRINPPRSCYIGLKLNITLKSKKLLYPSLATDLNIS